MAVGEALPSSGSGEEHVSIYKLIEQARKIDSTRSNEGKEDKEQAGRIRHDELDALTAQFEKLKGEGQKQRLKLAYELALDGVLDYIESLVSHTTRGSLQGSVAYNEGADKLQKTDFWNTDVVSKAYLEKVLKLRNLSHDDQIDIDTFGKELMTKINKSMSWDRWGKRDTRDIAFGIIKDTDDLATRLVYIQEAIENDLVANREDLFKMRNATMLELGQFQEVLDLVTQNPGQMGNYELRDIIDDVDRGQTQMPNEMLIKFCLFAISKSEIKEHSPLRRVPGALARAYYRSGDPTNALKYFRANGDMRDSNYQNLLKSNPDLMTPQEGIVILRDIVWSDEKLQDTTEIDDIAAKILAKKIDPRDRVRVLEMQVEGRQSVFRDARDLKIISGDREEKTFHAYIAGLDTHKGGWFTHILSSSNYNGALPRIKEVEALLSDMKKVYPESREVVSLQRVVDIANAQYNHFTLLESGKLEDGIAAAEVLVGYPNKESVRVLAYFGRFTAIDSILLTMYKDHKKPTKGINYLIGVYNEYLDQRSKGGQSSRYERSFQKHGIGGYLEAFLTQLIDSGKTKDQIKKVLIDAGIKKYPAPVKMLEDMLSGLGLNDL